MRTALAIRESIVNGETSVEAVVTESLARIARCDGNLGAFLEVHEEAALLRAKELDQAVASGRSDGALFGVPVAIKDNICTRTGHTTCASRGLRTYRSPYDAHVVSLLEEAGAVIIGKTNLDEFAMGSSTENSGFQPTRNPWDPRCVPGGSSGGSAVAVAAGMVPLALGSDTGGSIRQPAALCGVVGLKPTYGRVSRYGLVAFASSLDQIGPLTTNAADAALMMNVIAHYDRRDSTCVNEPVPNYAAELERSVQGLRIGVPAEYFEEGLSPEVRSLVEAALRAFERAGVELCDVHLPHSKYGIVTYYLINPSEASSNLSRFDGIHYGLRADADEIVGLYSASREAGFGPEVKRRIMLGTYALSAGYYDAYYVKAQKVRSLIQEDFRKAFERVDVIASPTVANTAFRMGEKVDDPLAMYLTDKYTISANLAGICAMSFPCGYDAKGLPIGMQFMGKAFGEGRLLNLVHQFEMMETFDRRQPQLWAA